MTQLPDRPEPGRPDPGRPDVDGGVPDNHVVVVLSADSPVDRELAPDRDLRDVLAGSEEFGPLVALLDRSGPGPAHPPQPHPVLADRPA